MSIKGEIYRHLPLDLKISIEIYKKTKNEEQKCINNVGNKPKIYIIGESDNGNVGDLAISLSQYEFVREKVGGDIEIIRILYSDFWKYFKWIEKNITEDDLIIIVGGGNIGDVYIEAEEIRQVIIRKYPQNEIIVFPSTIFYQNTSKNNEIYQKSLKIYNTHKKLFLYARERYSYDLLKKFYPHCKVYLLPDIVFSYPYITNNLPRENKILLCLRHDAEGVLSENQINKILDVCKSKCKHVFFTDTFIENVYAPDDSKRKEIIQKKLAEFSQAQLIITDRLHGMILAYLSKTPCIVLSNYNYKIEGVYEWIKEIEWVVYTDKIEKIDSLTDELMGKTFIKDSKKLEYKTLEKQLDSWVKQWR